MAAAQAALQAAQIALNDMTLVAPFDGIVAVVNVEVGEQVAPGAAAVRLADFSSWRIETEDLTELNVVDVEPNAPVEITFDALPDEEFSGRVVSIRPLGESKQGDITYTVVVEMDRQDPRLRWNMTAETTILPLDLVAKAPGKAASIPGPDTAPIVTTGLAAPQNTPAQTQSGAETANPAVTATVSTDGANLNVRSGPGTAYPITGSARSQETLTIVGRNGAGSWLLVVLSEGHTGWVSAAYTVVEGDLRSLRVSGREVSGREVEAVVQPWSSPGSSEQPSNVQPAPSESAVPSGDAAQPPDGLAGALVFQASSGGAIYVYEFSTDTLRQLTAGMDPALSPDGQTVVFVRDGGESGLYLISGSCMPTAATCAAFRLTWRSSTDFRLSRY